jgi:hypothetical protein
MGPLGWLIIGPFIALFYLGFWLIMGIIWLLAHSLAALAAYGRKRKASRLAGPPRPGSRHRRTIDDDARPDGWPYIPPGGAR